MFQLEILDEVGSRTRGPQRGLCFDESALVRLDHTDTNGRADVRCTRSDERLHALEVPDREIAVAPIPLDPRESLGTVGSEEELATPFEDPEGAHQQPNRSRVTAASGEPRGSNRGVQQRTPGTVHC